MMCFCHVEWRHMNVQLDEFHILHVVLKKYIRSFRGYILDKTAMHALPINNDIHMPPDVNAALGAVFIELRRIWRRT